MRAWMIPLMLLGCGAPKAPPHEAPVPMDVRMAHHFGLATRAQEAVIAGDLPAAQRAAADLASTPTPPDISAVWAEDFAVVHERAAVVANAPTLPEAGRAVARLGLACSACHAREGKGPRVPIDETDNAWAASKSPMERHIWATRAAWIGVVGADVAPFEAGMRALAEGATLDPKGQDSGFDGLQRRIIDLAAAAPAERTPDARASVYGELIATCAACHTRYR